MLQSNEKAPHVTVVWVKAITYELLPTGECSGTPVNTIDEILKVDGSDKSQTVNKTKELIQEIKECAKSKQA